MKVVTINTALLANAPRRLVLNLPGGTRVTAVRRRDHARLATTAMASPMTADTLADGVASIWVGEVLGLRGGLSSVVLVKGEGGGFYGSIRYLDRKAGRIRTFTVAPVVLAGADPVVASALPTFTPQTAEDGSSISLADLYPATHPTDHLLLEYQEAEPEELSPEEEEKVIYRGPPELANARPTVLLTEPPGAPTTVPLATGLDPEALAASIAAAAGPEVAAELGPQGFLEAAHSWIQRAQTAATAPAATLAPEGEPGGAPDTGDAVAAGAGTAGRKLKQAVFNTRQDILMMHTSSAASQVTGGATALQALQRQRIVETNKVYVDSGTRVDLILVGQQATSYSNNAISSTILSDMRNGNVSSLSTARDALGADFVQLWTGSTTSTCGIGYVPGSTTSAPPLMSAVNALCFKSSGLTVTHEIGHNQGCSHLSADTGSLPDYAAGFRVCGVFNTVMAYQCSGSTRIAYLSNPNLRWNGRTIGDTSTGWCAKRVTETAGFTGAVTAEKNPTWAGSIRSGLSASKCVDAASFAQGTQMAINDCSASRSYQLFMRLSDGRLQSPSTTRCMQAANTSTSGVFPVLTWDCSATSLDQMWFNDTMGRLHPYSAPDRCLTLPNSNTANGQVLVVQACGATAAANQRWTASNSSMFAAPFNPQNSRLRSNLVPQQCMELLAYNTTNGAPVAMMPCNANTTTNSNQRWTFSSSNNTLQLVFNTGKCLQAGASGATGAPITIADCDTSSQQRWFMDSLSRLRPYSAPSRCLNIVNAITQPGAALALADCVDLNQQKWTVIA